MDYLNDMALFVEVARVGSFRGAAGAIGIPSSTLSRRIAALEKSIGLRLLHRTTRKVELTEAGHVYYDRSRRIIDEARVAHEELGELVAQPSGSLRVSLPVDFATTYLAPLLPEFAQRFPGITFEFDLTPRNVDLVSEPFDLAIRMASPESPHLIARVVARLSAELYASPGYLDMHGEPHKPEDLENHQCLNMRHLAGWKLHNGAEAADVSVGSRFKGNSVALFRQLALQNLGILFLPERVVREDVAAGRLRRILPGWSGPTTPVYAVTETRLLPARTQRFIEFLRESLPNS